MSLHQWAGVACRWGNAVTAIEGPEIVIGLVGAVGADLEAVTTLIESELAGADYATSVVRVSDLLKSLGHQEVLRHAISARLPEDERIDRLMDAGDRLRRDAGRGDAAALLSIARMRDLRRAVTGSERVGALRHAFVLRSLKHPHEVDTLREVYGQAFFAVSVYAPRSARRQALARAIARSRHDFDENSHITRADGLIDRDEKAAGDSLGQNVRDAFPAADIFLDATDPQRLRLQVARMVELLLGHPFRTPTLAEYVMFHALAASLRSADLSRQVGAVITSDDGDIIAAGCNEVPKAGGGSVWETGASEEDPFDDRDFRIGYDSSARMKQQLVGEMLSRLAKAGWLRPDLSDATSEDLVELALFKGQAPILKGTRADNLLEFGRIVHAEMAALSVAARRGLPVRGATLYCTTFPCHMCARHIIAAGIQRVVYIEPYPKSLAKELYRKAVRLHGEEGSESSRAVDFLPFTGVAPRRYHDLFAMRPRKNSRGLALEWGPRHAMPRVPGRTDYIDREAAQLDFLTLRAEALGLSDGLGAEATEGGR